MTRKQALESSPRGFFSENIRGRGHHDGVQNEERFCANVGVARDQPPSKVGAKESWATMVHSAWCQPAEQGRRSYCRDDQQRRRGAEYADGDGSGNDQACRGEDIGAIANHEAAAERAQGIDMQLKGTAKGGKQQLRGVRRARDAALRICNSY